MAKWIIDAGHGGKDSGAFAQNTKEKDLNLQISLYQYNRLKALGVNVLLTRSTDVTLEASERTKKVNNLGGANDYCISNHLNAGGGTGVETIHSIHTNNALATKLANAVVGASGLKFRRVFTRRLANGNDYYFMHRETKTKTIIIEYGFIDSVNDLKVFKEKFEAIAESVIKVICEVEGVKYIAPNQAVEPKPATPTATKYYKVQVGAFSKKENADKLAKELQAKGYPTSITYV